MRFLFFITAITIMAAWYGWYIRPGNPTLSNQIFMVTSIVGLLLVLAFFRFV